AQRQPVTRCARPRNAPSGRSRLVVLVVELFARHRLLGDLDELEQEVDHLLLVDRGPQARHGARVLAIIVPDLLLLARELPGAIADGARQLLLAHLDIVPLADLRNDQAEADPALGDLAVLLASGLLRRILVGERAPLRFQIGGEGAPDVGKLLLDEGRREIALLARIERGQAAAPGPPPPALRVVRG